MAIFTRKILFALILVSSIARAQDPHFSQFYLSPLTLNPALAGDIDETYRAGAIYRNQYGSVTVPYVTPSASFDMNVFKGSESHDYLGLGLLILNDRSGDGNLSNLTVMLSAAYHQSLDQDGNFHLNFGLQGGWVQKSIDLSNLYFTSQYSTTTNSFSIPASESFAGSNINYPDFAAGVGLSGQLGDYSSISVGGAAFHLTQPIETFMGSQNVLPRKYVFYASGTFGLNNKFYFFPSAIYMLQQADNTVNIGTSVGFNFTSDDDQNGKRIFYLGCYNRTTGADAIIPTLGFIIHQFQLGLAYDINTSTLNMASGGKGAFEIGLTFKGDISISNFNRRHDRQYDSPKFN